MNLERPVIRSVADALQHGTPERSLLSAGRRFGRAVAGMRAEWQDRNRDHFQRSLADQAAHERGELPFIGHLWGSVLRNDGSVEDLGLMSCRVVTTAGVNFIVDAFQGLVEPEAMRYHGVGTGSTAEAVGNTALATELTTQYSTANTRPQGSLGEKAGSANIFETTATITVSAGVAVTEHGVFSQAAVPGGVLLDRSVFAAVNLSSGESMQVTYQLTVPAGS